MWEKSLDCTLPQFPHLRIPPFPSTDFKRACYSQHTFQQKILYFSTKLKGPTYNTGVEFWAPRYHSLAKTENLIVDTFSEKHRCIIEEREKEK